MSADDELYDAKVEVLGEYVAHHVQGEEGGMFPRCRRSSINLAGFGASTDGAQVAAPGQMPA